MNPNQLLVVDLSEIHIIFTTAVAHRQSRHESGEENRQPAPEAGYQAGKPEPAAVSLNATNEALLKRIPDKAHGMTRACYSRKPESSQT